MAAKTLPLIAARSSLLLDPFVDRVGGFDQIARQDDLKLLITFVADFLAKPHDRRFAGLRPLSQLGNREVDQFFSVFEDKVRHALFSSSERDVAALNTNKATRHFDGLSGALRNVDYSAHDLGVRRHFCSGLDTFV